MFSTFFPHFRSWRHLESSSSASSSSPHISSLCRIVTSMFLLHETLGKLMRTWPLLSLITMSKRLVRGFQVLVMPASFFFLIFFFTATFWTLKSKEDKIVNHINWFTVLESLTEFSRDWQKGVCESDSHEIEKSIQNHVDWGLRSGKIRGQT